MSSIQEQGAEATGPCRAPEDVIQSVFPEGIQTSHLMQGNVLNSRHLACLHSLKRNRRAPSIIQRMITEKSRHIQDNRLVSDGWRVYFAPPFDNQPVDVKKSDLNSTTIDGEKVELLHAGQIGDKVLLIAASRWRKQFGTSDSVQALAHTFVQGEHSRDPNEFFRFCLNDRIVEVFNIAPHEVDQPLSSLESDRVYGLLDQFAEKPDVFLFTAGTRDFGTLEDSTSEYLLPFHMYSLLRAESRERTVTLANPHDTETQEFTLTYDTFIQNFRRLAGIRLEQN